MRAPSSDFNHYGLRSEGRALRTIGFAPRKTARGADLRNPTRAEIRRAESRQVIQEMKGGARP
jgi:hypothetical protein